MNNYTLQRIVLFFISILLTQSVSSQNCPKLKVGLIDGCGRDGVNEFLILETRGQTVNLADIKVEYSTTSAFTPGASTIVINPGSVVGAWKNPSVPVANGLTNSTGTILAVDPGVTTSINPAQVVVIFPDGGTLTNPYDFQSPGQVQVLFYDTTHPVGTSSGWTGAGNFSNFGNTGNALNPRFIRLTTNSGGGCPVSQVVSYTPSNLIRVNGTAGAQDGARTNWDDAADASATPSDNNGTVHYVNTGCSQIVLPIKLLSFQGSVRNGYCDLEWETGPGSDAISFEIERSNKGGDNFQSIGNVLAQTGNVVRQYTFEDKSPVAGNNLYRLRMEDADGQLSYSNILQLTTAAKGGISIYPNPVMDRVTISIENNSDARATLIRSDGQVILNRSFSGTNILILDLGNYAKGVYFLRITNGEDVSSHELYKQ